MVNRVWVGAMSAAQAMCQGYLWVELLASIPVVWHHSLTVILPGFGAFPTTELRLLLSP